MDPNQDQFNLDCEQYRSAHGSAALWPYGCYANGELFIVKDQSAEQVMLVSVIDADGLGGTPPLLQPTTSGSASIRVKGLLHPPALPATQRAKIEGGEDVKFEFNPKDNGHTIMFGSTREAMAGMVVRRSLLPLSAPSQFAADVLMALGCQREALQSNGVSLAALSRVLGVKSTQEGDRRILDALLELKRLVPALSELRYCEADGLVRASDVHQ